jgi:flotillin
MLTRATPIAITSGIIPLATSYYRSRALQKPDSRNFSIMSAGGITSSVTLTILAGATAFAINRYHVSEPDEYVVRTGLGIPDMVISKTGIQWPFQNCTKVNMQPKNYSIILDAMSNQMMEFRLPGVYTIGPKNDIESLKKYCRYLSNLDIGHGGAENSMDAIIKGIIEGETRVLAAQMTLDDIFNNRAEFKEKIIENIQKELDKYGLEIFNGNIKELHDKEGSEYFALRRKKTLSEAIGKARIDTAEAEKNADVGEKERNIETRKQVAEFEAQAVEKENDAKKRIFESNAALAVTQAELYRQTEIAKIDSEKAAKIRDYELQEKVEQRRLAQETEYRRAQEMSKAQVDAEKAVKEAEGQSQSVRIAADAALYESQKRSEGKLYDSQKIAEGTLADLNSQSQGMQELVGAFGGDTEALLKYLLVRDDVLVKLGKSNADAIQGLNPKINHWNMGGGNADPISNILKLVPPVLGELFGVMKMPGSVVEGSSNLDSIKPDDIKEFMTQVNKKNK